MTGTDCGLFTHNQSRSYLNYIVLAILFYLCGMLKDKVNVNNHPTKDTLKKK